MRKYSDENYVNEIFQKLYPIGSIYLSTISTNPSSLFGFGTWERIQDKFLLAAGGSYTAGDTGGSATHQLTIDEMPSHTHKPTTKTPGTDTHNVYAFTINRHYSSSSVQRGTASRGSDLLVMAAAKAANDYGGNSDIDQSLETAPTGGGAAHNNMPPYLVVYIWKRVS